IAVVGRAAFIAIPFFKPVAAIVIITGVTLGAQSGFLCGAISMLVSNFIIGQGAWTPWQMVAFGIIGFISGAIFYKNPNRQKPKYIAIYGAISFFIIVGPILDLSTVFMASQIPDITAIMAIFLAGIPVNLVQAIATLIFLLVLTKPMLEKLNRIKIKYGMME
ncbi:MAG: ECF transporter S component, partial [Oscillospiraceae bacterium]